MPSFQTRAFILEAECPLVPRALATAFAALLAMGFCFIALAVSTALYFR